MNQKRIRGKAVIFPYPERAELREDVGFPSIDDDTVTVKTRYSAISRGTEMDLYHNQMHKVRGKSQWYPMIPGYEGVGEVVEIGKNVKGISVGDRVCVANLFGGYEKPYCCAWGGQVEYLVVNYTSHPRQGPGTVVKIPDGVSYQEATFHVLGGTAYHGIEKVKVQEGDTVMIIGQGVVGMMAAQIAKSRGADVIVSDLYPSRLHIAKKVGIQKVVNAQEENQLQRVMDLTEGKGADLVIETTGENPLLRLALEMVRDHGKVHAQGMYLEPILLYIPDTLLIKSLSLSSTAAARSKDRKSFLDLIAQGRLKVKDMITKTVSIDEATETYDDVDKKPEEILNLVFRW